VVKQEIKDIIGTIKENKISLKNIPMKDLLEATTNHTVIPYSETHKGILKEIDFIGGTINHKFKTKPITRQLFQNYRGRTVNAFRNNEVGDYCEGLIKETFEDNKENFKKITDIIPLRGKGYPDLKILTNTKNIFLEVKATSRPDVGSARDFYYSIGTASEGKIDCSALHILISFITKQIPNKSEFLIKGYKLVDVSKIKVRLKPEFNTDNLGIYNSETIIQL